MEPCPPVRPRALGGMPWPCWPSRSVGDCDLDGGLNDNEGTCLSLEPLRARSKIGLTACVELAPYITWTLTLAFALRWQRSVMAATSAPVRGRCVGPRSRGTSRTRCTAHERRPPRILEPCHVRLQCGDARAPRMLETMWQGRWTARKLVGEWVGTRLRSGGAHSPLASLDRAIAGSHMLVSKIKPCMSKYKRALLPRDCEWLIKSVIVYLMVPLLG